MADPATSISIGWEILSATLGLGGTGGFFSKILWDRYKAAKPEEKAIEIQPDKYVTITACDTYRKHCDPLEELDKQFQLFQLAATNQLEGHDALLLETNTIVKEMRDSVNNVEKQVAVAVALQKARNK